MIAWIGANWPIVVLVASVVTVFAMIATAPLGYEDENGWHEGIQK